MMTLSLFRSPRRRLTIGSMVGHVPDTTFSYLRQPRWVRLFLLSIWLRISCDKDSKSYMWEMKIQRLILSSASSAASVERTSLRLKQIQTLHRQHVTQRIMGFSPLRIWLPVISLGLVILLSGTALTLLFSIS